MWRNAHETYLEERILSADPVELVHMLYQAAITAVADARHHLAEQRILERARSISKTCDILMELNTSLDFERGGEFSLRLSHLYGYLYRRLVEANVSQKDEPLAEVAGLLHTLMEGWEGAKAGLQPQTPRENLWMAPAFAEPEFASASGSWSL
ncbi:MAG TPA: flagellar export chaperone FliS [Bryobacteraceae bacterium]|nr:flagellar export chaperone FliS [Bryobacteraceae bacterium]